MIRFGGGYTILEVMLFLAISGVIFAGAVTVFSGQQDRTSFEQGVRDFASLLQKNVDDISATSVATGSYSCSTSVSTGRPVLSSTTSSLGTSQDCIFLGRAVQVVPTQQKIFTYTVLGNKNTSSGESVTSFANAMPTPALTAGTDLTEEYFTGWGKVLSSSVTTTSGTTSASTLVGFYNSLQDGFQNSGVSGSQSIFAKGYNFTSSALNTARSNAIQSCIQEDNANGVTCANAPIINSWKICFGGVQVSQTAFLTVTSTPAGINTDVNFTSCS